jgi:hypothetical protein
MKKATQHDRELITLASNLYRDMFNEELNLTNIRFNSRITRRLGFVRYIRNNETGLPVSVTGMEISDKLIDNMDRLMLVLRHELIHIYCIRKYQEAGHTGYFQKYSNKFKTYFVNPRTGRFMYTCA